MGQTVQQMGIPTRGRVACHRTLKQAAHLPRTAASLRGIDPHWFGVTGFLVFLPLPCPSSIQVHMSVFQQLPTSKIWMVQENSSVLFPLVLVWFCGFFFCNTLVLQHTASPEQLLHSPALKFLQHHHQRVSTEPSQRWNLVRMLLLQEQGGTDQGTKQHFPQSFHFLSPGASAVR